MIHKTFIPLIIISLLQSCSLGTKKTHYKEAAALWQQHAGELRGLYYQAFNVARIQLDIHLEAQRKNAKNKGPQRPLAIVADIDETILDNSPYLAQEIRNGGSYPAGWKEWINSQSAVPLPGSVDFFTYAHSKGVQLYYISNRPTEEYTPTLNNLKKFNFPVQNENLLLLDGKKDKNKTLRRSKVLETHKVIMYLGDNLNDFSDIFDRQSFHNRKHLTDEYKEKFGTEFIIFPNPMYGDWESGLHDYKMNKNEDELADERRLRLSPH